MLVPIKLSPALLNGALHHLPNFRLAAWAIRVLVGPFVDAGPAEVVPALVENSELSGGAQNRSEADRAVSLLLELEGFLRERQVELVAFCVAFGSQEGLTNAGSRHTDQRGIGGDFYSFHSGSNEPAEGSLCYSSDAGLLGLLWRFGDGSPAFL